MNRTPAVRAVLFVALAAAACGGPPGPTYPGPAVPGPPNAPTPADTGANTNAASGLYSLTLTIGAECTAVPESDRTRKYSARLSDDGPGRYIVTLGDAAFTQFNACIPLGCNQFRASEDGNTMRFSLENQEWWGGYITEITSDRAWMSIHGEAAGARRATAIEASGPGHVRCPSPAEFHVLPPATVNQSEIRLRTVHCELPSPLAGRTIERRAAGLGAPLNAAAASARPARLVLAVVDAEPVGAVRRIALPLDRLEQDLLDLLRQSMRWRARLAGRGGQDRRGTHRRQPRSMQRFDHVDVAEAGDDTLIEQRRLERRLLPLHARASVSPLNSSDRGSGPSVLSAGCAAT